MQKPRLIVGLILIAAAVLMFVFGTGSYSTAGVIALLVIGLASIASSSSLSEKSDTPNKDDFRINSRYDKKI